MARFVLFGMMTRDLDSARKLVETAIEETLDERDGLHMGGIYYSLGFPNTFLKLRANVDLDDEELEFQGLCEPDYPDHSTLLYVSYVDEQPEAAATLHKLEGNPEVFQKLRVE